MSMEDVEIVRTHSRPGSFARPPPLRLAGYVSEALGWVKEHIGELLPNPPTITAGHVVANK
jgi:hypothetical protein